MDLYDRETTGPHSKTLSQKKRKWQGAAEILSGLRERKEWEV